jgi:integral membrane protein
MNNTTSPFYSPPAPSFFNKIAFAEGVSYIALIGVAMPLKYLFEMPLAVTYVGWAHGVLFVSYCACLPYFLFESKWKFTRCLRAFVLALLPFGTFRRL